MFRNKFGASIIMKDVQGFFTIEQFRTVLREAYKVNIRAYILFQILYKTGRRISEALQLRPQDIDFEGEKIAWIILKRKPPIKVWLPANRELLHILKEYIKIFGIERDEFLCPYKRCWSNRLLVNICKRIGITKLGNKKPHVHCLRHQFAIHFIQANGSTIEVLAALNYMLQHASIENTFWYLQFGKNVYQEYINKTPETEQLDSFTQEQAEKLMEKGMNKVDDRLGDSLHLLDKVLAEGTIPTGKKRHSNATAEKDNKGGPPIPEVAEQPKENSQEDKPDYSSNDESVGLEKQ